MSGQLHAPVVSPPEGITPLPFRIGLARSRPRLVKEEDL